MIELDIENGSIEFKKPVSLDNFGKAMFHFGKMYMLLFGVEPTYKEFTDFLSTQPGVKLMPGIKVKEAKNGKS